VDSVSFRLDWLWWCVHIQVAFYLCLLAQNVAGIVSTAQVLFRRTTTIDECTVILSFILSYWKRCSARTSFLVLFGVFHPLL